MRDFERLLRIDGRVDFAVVVLAEKLLYVGEFFL